MKRLNAFFPLLAMWSSRNMKWGVMLYQSNGPYTGAKYFLLVENTCTWHQQSFFVCCFTILPCNIFNNLFLEKKNKISLISFMQWTCIKFMNFLMKPHRSTLLEMLICLIYREISSMYGSRYIYLGLLYM